MTQREFATRLLEHINAVNAQDPDCFTLYHDKHANGDKVLRIKTGANPTYMPNVDIELKLRNYLADYPNISKVTVRECRDSYVGLDWCIQIEYRGSVPDLDSPKPVAATPEPEVKETVTEGGLIKVETPFGIGYATDEVDKARMLLWLEGVKAGMAYVEKSQAITYAESQVEDTESPDLEADFDADLAGIDADHASEWWTNAEELRAKYPTIDDVTASDLMSNAFDEWFHSQE